MIRYASTIFLSAFLLFQIQPMIAKFILPWYGGTAVVWTTCMMFFQVVLLLGYLYAHLLRTCFSPRIAWFIHIVLLLMAAVLLQAQPPEHLKPSGGEQLTWAIVHLLSVTIGVPFFALSTTGPLVQAWHNASHGGKTYRLYAVSNLGSMLALLTYPFFFEPVFPLGQQARFWMIAFFVFAVICSWSGWQTLSQNSWVSTKDRTSSSKVPLPSWKRIALWLLLATAPSAMLLATTNLMCQEVASIPFLWILPLVLYLVSLIICFDRPVLYQRWVFIPLLLCSCIFAVILLQVGNNATLLPQIIGLALVCFACSMSCHGELERLKPNAQHLTLFFLVVSAGGALGGIFVVIVAPQIFTEYFEFDVALAVSVLATMFVVMRQMNAKPSAKRWPIWALCLFTIVAVGMVVANVVNLVGRQFADRCVDVRRNEYGQITIRYSGSDYLTMVNGRTRHGGQFQDEDRMMEHNGYYSEGSGPAIAIPCMRESNLAAGQGEKLKIGIVGLGTGAMVTWAEPQDKVIFYEVNPLVEKMARGYFTYLDSRDCEVVLGDGRTQLESQFKSDGSMKFDVLLIDAFSSDSIPAHLLTRECFDIYWKHIKPDGVLMMHITNRFARLGPVVYHLAKEKGFDPVLVVNRPPDNVHGTDWVCVTRNKSVLDSNLLKDASVQWREPVPEILWTDDFASMAQVIDWRFRMDVTRIFGLNPRYSTE